MEINKLLSVLRNPYGIEYDVVQQARLEAADIVEKVYHKEENKSPKKHRRVPFGVLAYKQKTNIKKDDFKGAPKNYIEEGKHDMSELPLDLLTELLCPAYQEGTMHKYFRNSWRLGFKMSVMMAACLRHLTKFFFMRETYDQETLEKYGIKKHHLGAAIFCIVAMYNDWKNHPANDDRREV